MFVKRRSKRTIPRITIKCYYNGKVYGKENLHSMRLFVFFVFIVKRYVISYNKNYIVEQKMIILDQNESGE